MMREAVADAAGPLMPSCFFLRFCWGRGTGLASGFAATAGGRLKRCGAMAACWAALLGLSWAVPFRPAREVSTRSRSVRRTRSSSWSWGSLMACCLAA